MWSIRNERLTTKKRGEGFSFSSSVARYVTIVKTSVGGRQHRICSPFHQQEKSFWNFFFYATRKGGTEEVHCHCQNVPATSQGEKIRIRSSRADDVEGEFDGNKSCRNIQLFFSAACEGSFLGGKLSILLHFPTHSTTACDFERMEIS